MKPVEASIAEQPVSSGLAGAFVGARWRHVVHLSCAVCVGKDETWTWWMKKEFVSSWTDVTHPATVHVLFPMNYSLLMWSPNGLGKGNTFASQVAKFVVFAVWYILIGVFLTFVFVFYSRMKDLFFKFSALLSWYILSLILLEITKIRVNIFYEFSSWLFTVPCNHPYAPTAHFSLFQLWVMMMARCHFL